MRPTDTTPTDSPILITPDLVASVAHNAYRQRLDSERDRLKFDELEPGKQKSRTVAFEPFTRAVLIALGYREPERTKPAKSETD